MRSFFLSRKMIQTKRIFFSSHRFRVVSFVSVSLYVFRSVGHHHHHHHRLIESICLATASQFIFIHLMLKAKFIFTFTSAPKPTLTTLSICSRCALLCIIFACLLSCASWFFLCWTSDEYCCTLCFGHYHYKYNFGQHTAANLLAHWVLFGVSQFLNTGMLN